MFLFQRRKRNWYTLSVRSPHILELITITILNSFQNRKTNALLLNIFKTNNKQSLHGCKYASRLTYYRAEETSSRNKMCSQCANIEIAINNSNKWQ